MPLHSRPAGFANKFHFRRRSAVNRVRKRVQVVFQVRVPVESVRRAVVTLGIKTIGLLPIVGDAVAVGVEGRRAGLVLGPATDVLWRVDDPQQLALAADVGVLACLHFLDDAMIDWVLLWQGGAHVSQYTFAGVHRGVSFHERLEQRLFTLHPGHPLKGADVGFPVVCVEGVFALNDVAFHEKSHLAVRVARVGLHQSECLSRRSRTVVVADEVEFPHSAIRCPVAPVVDDVVTDIEFPCE